MKKHNLEIVQQLRSRITPMNKFKLYEWLETNLAETDISATANSCFDKKGFVAHEVILDDNNGASRTIVVPSLSDSFTFEENGIYARYGIIPPKARVKNKNMYVVEHESGYILLSYTSMICFYNFAQNIVYFKRNAYQHSVTTSKHIHHFLTHFVKKGALKMYAKQVKYHD